MTRGRGTVRRKGAAGVRQLYPYTPPSVVVEIPAREAGITDEYLLKVPTLYIAGDRDLLAQPMIAIVGSRKASPEGQRRAERMAREAVKAGLVVMSGLAEGIDQAAHRAAIAAGGRTVAVVGTPVDRVYPAQHAQLQEQIYREHLLVSPFKIGTKTYPSSFPERNRVMARLSRATVIIEAGDTSGALHQAVECLKVGRALFIAESVARNKDLKWPERFIGKPDVHVLAEPHEVIAQAYG